MKKFLLLLAAILISVLYAADKNFPDANVILLDDREYVTYQTDGTDERTDVCRYRIRTYKGLLEMRNINLHYNSTYGTLEITQLEITKADGKSVKLDPAALAKTGIDSSQMSSRIYDPAQKQLSVTVPGLEIGDILTFAVRRRTLKPRLPGQWSDICVLQSDCPIINYEYTVNAPAAKPLLAIAAKDTIDGTLDFSQSREGDRIIYRWRARNVPQAIAEPAMPELYTCCQRVLVSTVGNWQEISRWYDELCAPRIAKVNSAMQQKVAELTAGKSSEMAKITALFQFVSQQIRYTGITDEEHAPGYEPHDVNQTFDRRHGVCRDKAALLVAMLKLAGIKAYPTLFMSGTPKDPEVPNIYFNHAIVAAEVNGEYVLMDPTFETTRELFPSYLAGDSFLVAKPDGDTIRTAPPVKAESNLLTITTAAELGDNHNLTGNIKLDFTGIYDQMYRAAFSEWTPDRVRDFLGRKLRDILPDAEIKTLRIIPANIRDMSTALAISITFSARLPDSKFLQMPRLSRALGLMDMMFAATALKQRKFPLRAMPRAVSETITVKLPENIAISAMPENIKVEKSGTARFSSTRQISGNTLNESNFFAVDAMKIFPATYPDLKSLLAAAENAEKSLPLIKNIVTGKEADSILLDYACDYQLLDSKNWNTTITFKRKILNYAGVDAHSEVRIAYIDGVDEVEISGTVTSPDGQVRTLSAKELNRMDAPGSAAMPRYPRQKIAVASFPNVVAGSVIDCKIVKKSRNKTHFFTTFVFQDYTPAKMRQISFTGIPQLNIETSGDLPQPVTTRDGRKTYSVSDIPALPQESDAPALQDFAPAVTAYTPVPAAEITAKLEAQAAAATPEISALAKQLAAGKSGIDAVDEIRKYVSLHIREAGYPLDPETFSTPQVTLADGYGSSADRAILLAALLKAVNVKYQFTLMTDRAIPRLNLRPYHRYNTVLITLPEYPGVYLNDLDLHGIPGSIKHADRKLADGTYPVPKHEEARVLSCDISISPNGTAELLMKYSYYGDYFGVECGRFAKFTPEMRKRHFEALAHAISPAAEILSSDADFSAHPAVITLKLRIPDFAVKSGKYYSFALPEYDSIIATVPNTGASRRLPLQLQRHTVNHIYRIKVPAAWKLVRDQNAFGTFFTDKNGLITIKQGNFSAFTISTNKFNIETVRGRYRQLNSPDSRNVLFIME